MLEVMLSNRVGLSQHILGNIQNPIMQIFSFRSFAFGFAMFDHLVVLTECNQCSFYEISSFNKVTAVSDFSLLFQYMITID